MGIMNVRRYGTAGLMGSMGVSDFEHGVLTGGWAASWRLKRRCIDAELTARLTWPAPLLIKHRLHSGWFVYIWGASVHPGSFSVKGWRGLVDGRAGMGLYRMVILRPD